MSRENSTKALFFGVILVGGFNIICGRVMVNPRSNLKLSQIEDVDPRGDHKLII